MLGFASKDGGAYSTQRAEAARSGDTFMYIVKWLRPEIRAVGKRI